MDDLLIVVENALKGQGKSARRASLDATGSSELVRMMRRGHVPSVERMRALANALGLEFYIGPPRSRSGSEHAGSQIDETSRPLGLALDRFTEERNLPVREWRPDGPGGPTRATGGAPAPDGLTDPAAFYVRANNSADMGRDDIWVGDHCLVCPEVAPAVGRRLWLRNRDGREILRRLVAVDADEYGLRACGPAPGGMPAGPPPFFVHRWRRAEVTATGTILAVYTDAPSSGKTQAPKPNPVKGLALWLQGGKLDDVELPRRVWRSAWGDAALDLE